MCIGMVGKMEIRMGGVGNDSEEEIEDLCFCRKLTPPTSFICASSEGGKMNR